MWEFSAFFACCASKSTTFIRGYFFSIAHNFSVSVCVCVCGGFVINDTCRASCMRLSNHRNSCFYHQLILIVSACLGLLNCFIFMRSHDHVIWWRCGCEACSPIKMKIRYRTREWDLKSDTISTGFRIIRYTLRNTIVDETTSRSAEYFMSRQPYRMPNIKTFQRADK